MKIRSIILISALIFCVSVGMAFAADNAAPKVVIRASAQVQGDFFTLGDIADITPAPAKCKSSALLASAVVGRSPMLGSTRTIGRGDIRLKLRQAGYDPQSIDIEGAPETSVSSDNAVDVAPSAGSQSQPVKSDKPQISVKAGDPVTIVFVNGPVVVRAKGFAVTSGAVGETISVRRDDATRNFSATIIDAGLVQLAE